jgi:hypothetical protein
MHRKDIMQETTHTYVLTVNAQQGLRLWTGTHIHALRHCSANEAGLVLAHMQQGLNDLQALEDRSTKSGR